MHHSVVPQSDAGRPIAGSTNESAAVKTRSLLRPAAQHLSLSLVEGSTFQFTAFNINTPSTSDDDNGTMTLRSCLDYEPISLATPSKSSEETLLSALTTPSVYSQESCTYQTTSVCADTRRFAIALESPDIDNFWPLATSPLSPSTGAFILNLRKPHETHDITPPSVKFMVEAALDAPYLVTSPSSFDATMTLNKMTTTCFQIPAGDQNSPMLLPQPSRQSAVASAALAYQCSIASSISTSAVKNDVEPSKGNSLSPTRRLGKLLSRIRHSTAAMLDASAENVSEVPRRDATKRRRMLCNNSPSIPRKQTSPRQQPFLLIQGSTTVSTQVCPIHSLPAISISPLAVSFEGVKDDIGEHDTSTSISCVDWDTIGIAL